MRTVRALLAAATLLTALTSAPSAWACSCVLDPDPPVSPLEFVGVATELAPRTDPRYRTWRFTVLAPVRGYAAGTTAAEVDLYNADVVNADGTRYRESCSMAFDVPGMYHVHGHPGPDGNLRIDACGHGGYTGVP